MKALKVSEVYVDFDLSDFNENVVDTLSKSELRSQGNESGIISPIKQKEDILSAECPSQMTSIQTSMNEELNFAVDIIAETKKAQSQLYENVLQGKTINLKALKKSTNAIVASIFRNPEALLLMSQLSNVNDYLVEHAINSCILMSAFSTWLELDEALIFDIAIGAFMHDIGKISIPKSILNKPEKLTPDEFEVMKKHVIYSKQILEKIPGISPVSVNVAAVHHKRLDDSGYPQKLIDEKLSPWGCMIGIVDTYDAMTADRFFQPACTSQESFEVMKGNTQQFDEEILQQFINCIGLYPVGSLVELESDRLAMVYQPNRAEPERPTIVSFYDTMSRHAISPEIIDLSFAANDSIKQGVRAKNYNVRRDFTLLKRIAQASCL